MNNTEIHEKYGLERGLLIRQPHIGKILDGHKTWEMRSTKTQIRGTIGLIESGTGLIVGTAEIVNAREPYPSAFARKQNEHFHGIPEDRHHLMDKWKYAWILKDVCKFDDPIPYTHPQGAVIWVKFTR